MDLFSPLLYNGRKGTYFILLACNQLENPKNAVSPLR